MTSTEGRVVIRPMEPEDIDAVLTIDRKISGVQRAITYTDLITGELGGVIDLSFVAEINGQVVGIILARLAYVGDPVTEVGLVQILGVDPDYQRQGIATKLVSAMLERCKSKGIKTVRVSVNERDSQLRGLFQRIGFRRGQLIDYSKTL